MGKRLLGGLMLLCLLWVTPAWATSIVELKDVAFSSRPELEPFYKLEQSRMRSANAGSINRQKELALYKSLFENHPGEDLDLKQWQSNGPNSPEMFRIRVQVHNYGNAASAPTPVSLEIKAKVGEFLVDPGSYLVDMHHLEQTAEWTQVTHLCGEIPAVAPGETFDWFSDPVPFGEFLSHMTHQYPVALKVNAVIDSPQAMHKTMTLEIPVKANNFALQMLPNQ